MMKQLPRDNRMYNINEGFNLKSKKQSMNSTQRIDSVLSMQSSQDDIYPRRKLSRPGTSITRLQSKRRNSISGRDVFKLRSPERK